MSRHYRVLAISILLVTLAVGCRSGSSRLEVPDDGSVVRIVYFYSVDCVHCHAVQSEVLEPLQVRFGNRMEIRWIETSVPENYELLIRTEERFNVAPEERGLPTLVIDGQILIGEEQIRTDLSCLLESCFAAGGTTWPEIPGLEEAEDASTGPLVVGPGLEPGTGEIAICPEDETQLACPEPAPIHAAYFYQVGCQACSRAEADIRYVRNRYPQLIPEEFNIYDHLDLALWMVEQAGREWGSFHTPAIFIGEEALVGAEEITPQSLEALVERYAPTGAEKSWTDADLPTVLDRIPSVLTVAFAGLVDGLNPCAFATLVFFVAYLTASERRGREILAVGGVFALGVLLTYLAVGLGFYKVLDLLGGLLTAVGRWVYGLTALLCASLAVLSLLDFFKARKGQVDALTLSLPGSVRARLNAVIRSGQKAQTYLLAAFVTGVVISLLELACTGQVYLPTIVFVSSIPELRAQAVSYLLLYNLLFILPLVVVFLVTYLGTSSLQLGLLLKRHTATVKLVTAVLFAALAVWLGLSLLP